MLSEKFTFCFKITIKIIQNYPILNKIPNKAAFIIMVRQNRLYMFQLNNYEN